jgi:hypothetical protein
VVDKKPKNEAKKKKEFYLNLLPHIYDVIDTRTSTYIQTKHTHTHRNMSALAQTFAATSASALASRKSSSFNARSSLMTSSTTSSSSSSRAARLQTFARVDGGVGVFGNKAGMTQIFTDDGLCVPVTVIAVKDGNYVSAVSVFLAFKNFISTGNPGVFLE